MNVRECRQCHKMVDFDEPWCDHETMEESAWIDIAMWLRGGFLLHRIADELIQETKRKTLE